MARAIEISENLSLTINDCLNNTEFSPASKKTGFARIKVQEYLNHSTTSIYEELSEVYDIDFNVTFSTINDDKYVYLNQESLKKARENIITNAIAAKATHIDIDFEMKNYCIVATFKDNGKGMTQEDLDKLMLQQHGDGILHGLGTQNILKTIEEHGFMVSYSSLPNMGTSIRLLIPYN
jgi:nitrogen fixation/metabolism regulation signal transduction histidine kinase